MKFILGRKLDMTQVFRPDGQVVPVTRIQAGPIVVTQVKTQGDKQVAVQVGFETARSVNKAQEGHLKGLALFKVLKEFPSTQAVKRGDVIVADTFAAGDIVDAVGTSKGKGFAGVVKRHHFGGAPKTHGHKHDLRAPGSIGAGGVQRVFKGMRMAGHMGDEQVTVKNLEIVAVDAEKNEILVKGAVPGARNSLIILKSLTGELVVKSTPVVVAEPQVEDAPVAEPEVESVATTEEEKTEEVTA